MKLALLAALLAPVAAFAADTTHAQAPLPKEDIVIYSNDGMPHRFNVEIASTPDQQEIGLMWRKQLAANQGMIFDWGAPQVSTMWMKNTLIPLDMVFVGSDGRVDAITEQAVPQSLAIISSGVPVRATIELQGGITQALDIRVGDKVQIPGL